MNKKLTTLIGSLALISGAAFAQTTGSGTTGQSGDTSDSSGVTGSSRSDTSSGMGASGQSGSESGMSAQGFSSLDKDNSGNISRREAASQQSLSRIFDRADEDKDGQLSQSEYQDAVSQDSTAVQ